MRSCFAIVCAVFVGLTTSYADTRQVKYQGDLLPLNITPTYDNGYVIAWDRNADGALNLHTITVYGPSGSKLYQASIQVPGQKYLSLKNGAIDTNGVVAVAFQQPNGFAILDQQGKQVLTVLTGQYAPGQICFAPDHSIWLSGFDFTGEDDHVFRKYSETGQPLGEFVPASSVSGLHSPQTIGGRAMRAYAGGIVALLEATSQSSPPQMRWVELSLDGQTVKQLGQHRDFYPWVLGPDGTIYAKEGTRFLYLDRASGTWKENTMKRPGSLAGADETGLVFLLSDRSTVEWASPTQ